MNPIRHSKYRTIYADPPWPEYGGGKIKRGANRHYPLMSLAAILQLGDALQEHIDNDGCHLYLWATNTHLANGFRVMEQWGFDYKTTITWCKDRFGLGQYYRGQTEHCLFGVRGRLPYRTTADGKRAQGVTAIHAPRMAHSAKPDEMRRMIEKVSYAPRLELFARRKIAGWDVWGNEVPSDISMAALRLAARPVTFNVPPMARTSNARLRA
jgi:N6-adenosine-specific RNA methylase IME4